MVHRKTSLTRTLVQIKPPYCVMKLFRVCPFHEFKYDLKCQVWVKLLSYQKRNLWTSKKNLLCRFLDIAGRFSRKKKKKKRKLQISNQVSQVMKSYFLLSRITTSIWFIVHRFFFFIIMDHREYKHEITFQEKPPSGPLLMPKLAGKTLQMSFFIWKKSVTEDTL